LSPFSVWLLWSSVTVNLLSIRMLAKHPVNCLYIVYLFAMPHCYSLPQHMPDMQSLMSGFRRTKPLYSLCTMYFTNYLASLGNDVGIGLASSTVRRWQVTLCLWWWATECIPGGLQVPFLPNEVFDNWLGIKLNALDSSSYTMALIQCDT